MYTCYHLRKPTHIHCVKRNGRVKPTKMRTLLRQTLLVNDRHVMNDKWGGTAIVWIYVNKYLTHYISKNVYFQNSLISVHCPIISCLHLHVLATILKYISTAHLHCINHFMLSPLSYTENTCIQREPSLTTLDHDSAGTLKDKWDTYTELNK